MKHTAHLVGSYKGTSFSTPLRFLLFSVAKIRNKMIACFVFILVSVITISLDPLADNKQFILTGLCLSYLAIFIALSIWMGQAMKSNKLREMISESASTDTLAAFIGAKKATADYMWIGIPGCLFLVNMSCMLMSEHYIALSVCNTIMAGYFTAGFWLEWRSAVKVVDGFGLRIDIVSEENSPKVVAK